jgi:hypothetical protein
MAHYARMTPPVRPPGRSLLPDQPWTAWWEIDDVELTAPRTAPHGVNAPTAAAELTATRDTGGGFADILVAEQAEPDAESALGASDGDVSLEDAPADSPMFPHADLVMGGGLQRIQLEAQPENSAAEDDLALDQRTGFGGPLRTPANWGLAEVAATGLAENPGVQTVYGRFTVEGFANRAGDLVFTGVTFPDLLSAVPPPGAIVLTMDEASNVIAGAVVVADLGGFTADRQGFTLITTAHGPGMVRAHGHYVVEI